MSVSHDEQQSGHGSAREPEDFLAEAFAQLRAADVKPMTEDELAAIGWEMRRAWMPATLRMARLLVTALEARAKLAAVREWAERHAAEPAASEVQAVGRLCGREVLEILDEKARKA